MLWFREDDVVARAGAEVVAQAAEFADAVSVMVSAGEIVSNVGYDDDFDVRVTGANGRLVGECSCGKRPEEFCVHCVAAVLMALDVASPPDPEELMRRVEAVGSRRKLSGANYEPWATAAFHVINDLDISSEYHPALVRPAYQRLMWQVAHTSVYFDSHEAYDTLLDVGERIVEGLARACENEPADPRELGRWTADLLVSLPDVQTPIHVHEFYETLDDATRSAYGERLAELQRALPVISADYDEPMSQAERRERIRRLREEYTLSCEPSTDELVAFYAEDVTDPMRDVSIAKALQSAGRLAEVIDRLECADPQPPGGDAVLAKLYSATGRHQEAARLWLTAFLRYPSRYSYNGLLAAAAPIDAVEYAKLRAFEHVAGLGDAHKIVWLLVELDELERAWTAAWKSSLSADVVARLAEILAERRGPDAVPLLAHGARTAIDQRSDYPLAARLLVTLRQLHQRIGQNFTPGFAHFTASYDHREELMRALRRAGL
ncbi:hypothetical protein [Kibdelosporangium aridum]|uniref:hypothetical protein n=1 Tax=Kibdelosporangium aridum TaxID=2030 RepID=UPI000F790A70|nr:hypothetical protein [Kibdelosporangium aridum]